MESHLPIFYPSKILFLESVSATHADHLLISYSPVGACKSAHLTKFYPFQNFPACSIIDFPLKISSEFVLANWTLHSQYVTIKEGTNTLPP